MCINSPLLMPKRSLDFCGLFIISEMFNLYIPVLLFSKCPRACPVCTQPLHSPVRLPCRHMICDTCVSEVKLCPDGGCDGQIPEGFIYNPADDQIE